MGSLAILKPHRVVPTAWDRSDRHCGQIVTELPSEDKSFQSSYVYESIIHTLTQCILPILVHHPGKHAPPPSLLCALLGSFCQLISSACRHHTKAASVMGHSGKTCLVISESSSQLLHLVDRYLTQQVAQIEDIDLIREIGKACLYSSIIR